MTRLIFASLFLASAALPAAAGCTQTSTGFSVYTTCSDGSAFSESRYGNSTFYSGHAGNGQFLSGTATQYGPTTYYTGPLFDNN